MNEDLESKTLRQFDALVERGELIWEAGVTQLVKATPFDFQFRIAPRTGIKPQLEKNDPGRKEDKNAFADEDPNFHLQHVGPSHTLILNKYCFVRPQFILHTNKFVPQSDCLTKEDLDAVWSVYSQLRTPHFIIYNCGFEGGSSLGHKHLQLLPLPEELGLFPDTLGVPDNSYTISSIPFRHGVRKIPAGAKSSDLNEIYQSLLKHASINDESPGHNVIIVKKWMLVIPRSQAKQGSITANASAMVGIVWMSYETQLKEWLEKGPMNLLRGFGFDTAE